MEGVCVFDFVAAVVVDVVAVAFGGAVRGCLEGVGVATILQGAAYCAQHSMGSSG